jgi:hypothetical protein
MPSGGSRLASVLLAGACAASCFETRRDLPHGERAFAVEAADVDTDGKADLVVIGDYGGELGDALSVRFGLGGDAFSEPTHTALPSAARSESLAVADLDRDGRLDVVAAHTVLFQVQSFLGNADGTFRPGPSRPTGEEPKQLVLGELDGDGWLDAAVACRDDGGAYLTLLFGGANAAFSETLFQTGEPGTVAFGVALGDVDRDGRLDVVTAGLAGGARLRVHLNRGGRAFEALPFFEGGSRAVSLADLDGNHVLDLVALGDASLRTFRGRGDGGFDAWEEFPVSGGSALLVTDLNDDGRADFAVTETAADRVAVFWTSQDDSRRYRQTLTTGSRPVSLAAANFDADARLELVTANSGSPGSLSFLDDH